MLPNMVSSEREGEWPSCRIEPDLLILICLVSGMYLRQCGAAEVKMGQALLFYHSRVQKEYLTPLRAFLEVDIKNIMVRRITYLSYPTI